MFLLKTHSFGSVFFLLLALQASGHERSVAPETEVLRMGGSRGCIRVLHGRSASCSAMPSLAAEAAPSFENVLISPATVSSSAHKVKIIIKTTAVKYTFSKSETSAMKLKTRQTLNQTY